MHTYIHIYICIYIRCLAGRRHQTPKQGERPERKERPERLERIERMKGGWVRSSKLNPGQNPTADTGAQETAGAQGEHEGREGPKL